MVFAVHSVLINGASRGIGLQFVKQLTKLPSPPKIIIASCRNPKTATDLQEFAKCHPSIHVTQMDVTVDTSIDKAVEATEAIVGTSGLTVLINNVGIFEHSEDGGKIRQMTRERLAKSFDVNTTCPVIVSQKFLPLLQRAADNANQDQSVLSPNRSAIVMISSIMGSQNLSFENPKGSKDNIDYRTSKSALDMATILMSRDLKESGILVFALHPGWVLTDMGGPNAQLTTEQSVDYCLKTIGEADESQHGRLVNYKGDILPF